MRCGRVEREQWALAVERRVAMLEFRTLGGLAALGLILAATPAATQRPQRAAALERLEPGLWRLRDLDDVRRTHGPVCLGDPHLLLQLQHRNSPCSRLVVAQDGRSATVHYTCPAAGFGQTLLKIETPRLVQIDTQGISNKAPFSYRVEARREGSCVRSARRAR